MDRVASGMHACRVGALHISRYHVQLSYNTQSLCYAQRWDQCTNKIPSLTRSLCVIQLSNLSKVQPVANLWDFGQTLHAHSGRPAANHHHDNIYIYRQERQRAREKDHWMTDWTFRAYKLNNVTETFKLIRENFTGRHSQGRQGPVPAAAQRQLV